MSNVVMCDADGCGAFFAEGMDGTSTGVEMDYDSGKQRALHYCDECTQRRRNARGQQIFRPNQAKVQEIETAQHRVQDVD